MKLTLCLCLAALWLLTVSMAQPTSPTPSQGGDWQALARQAEAHFTQGSFEKAHSGFEEALGLAEQAGQAGASHTDDLHWLRFRSADALLRSLSSTRNRDSSKLDAAHKQLMEMAPMETPVHERNLVWAEVHEALGDHHLQTRRVWGLGSSQSHYQAALDFWAASSDLDVARERWLSILWKMGWPSWSEGDGSYGQRNQWLPMEWLEQGLKIANTDEDRARLQFMIARTCMQQGNGPWWDRRMQTAFAMIREMDPDSTFFEHGAWYEAQWLENQGPWMRTEEGQAYRKPDPAAALERYRAIVQSSRPGRSPYHKGAQEAIDRILGKELNLYVNQAFLTGSKAGYQLSTRNLARVELNLYPIRLHEAVDLDNRKDHAHEWLESIDIPGTPALARWTIEPSDDNPHAPVHQTLAIEGDLPAGSYLLFASSEGKTSKALVLVTETAVTLRSSSGETYAWVTDARTGKPIGGQTVRAKVRIRDRKGRGSWTNLEAETKANGLAHFQAGESRDRHEYFLSVETEKGPAFALLTAYNPDENDGWRVHVVTDRPAYRPDQTVQWKLVARRHTGLEYTTPQGVKLQAKLIDPRGGEVDTAEVTLSAFGSAFGTFATGSDMPLGQYTLQLFKADSSDLVGSANLFRLEEYKRPEFEVTVQTPKDETGRAAVFILGDEVHAEVKAQTYFGSPVAGAKVEVVIYRSPYHAQPTPRGRFQWFSDTLTPEWERHNRFNRWNREEVQRTEIVSDENGIAQVRFNTPFGEGQEFEYQIEARVTDASRREVTGTGNVRVRRQAYSAELELSHRIHRPGGTAPVTVHTSDANDNPMPVDGKLHLYRARWVEIWLGPNGNRMPNQDVRKARAGLQFPPPGWNLRRSRICIRRGQLDFPVHGHRGSRDLVPHPAG